MDDETLTQYCSVQWAKKVKRCESTLEPYESDQAVHLRTRDEIEETIFDDGLQAHHHADASDLEPVKRSLAYIQRFITAFQVQLGVDLDSSLLWALLGLNLQLCQQHPQALKRVPRFLKTVGTRLEHCRELCSNKRDLPPRVKEACFDIHLAVLDFLSELLSLLHTVIDGEAGDPSSDQSWRPLTELYNTFTLEIDEAMATVEKQKDVQTSSPDRMTTSSLSARPSRPPRVVMLPSTLPTRFFNRDNFNENIDKEFEDALYGHGFRSLALYGLGGVGKSSIALRYAEYVSTAGVVDAVFWIHSQKDMAMRQSFTDIALRLRLTGARPQAHDENFLLVQDWTRKTEQRWLLIFDNVESKDMLLQYWPTAVSHGKVIITTRDRSIAFEVASSSLEVPSWDAETGSRFLLFLLAKAIGDDLVSETRSALELSRRLDGHALAISNMAGLIQRRSWTIEDFFRAYQRDPRKLHKSALNAVWQLSFESLDPDGAILLGIVSYLMPDSIPEELFLEGPTDMLPPELEFCADEMRFSDATETLLTLTLLKRDARKKNFSIHRMVQTQYRFFMSKEERERSLAQAATLLWRLFPSEQKPGTKIQFYSEWELCERYIQHVLALKESFKEAYKEDATFHGSVDLARVFLAASRYLFETHNYMELEDMDAVNKTLALTLDHGQFTVGMESARLSYIAQMQEAIGDVSEGIKNMEECYRLSLIEDPTKPILVSTNEVDLGIFYDTANDHTKAKQYFEKARVRWSDEVRDGNGNPVPWYTFHKMSYSRCMVYLGENAEATRLVDESISEYKSSDPVNWAMIASSLFIKATLEHRRQNFDTAEETFAEAQSTWLSGDKARIHPFNGACMYRMGWCALTSGKIETAIKHLNDSMIVTEFQKTRSPVEHARNLFALSQALEQNDPDGTSPIISDELRREAERLLRSRHPETSSANSDEDYNQYVPISWR